MKLRKLVTSIGLVLLGGCTFSASCNGGKTLNTKNAEAFAEKFVTGQTGLEAKATCPAKVKVEKGGRFDCSVVVGGVTATVTVEQTDDKTNVEVKALSGLLITSKLEAQILERLSKQATTKIEVDCGPRVRAATPGETFECHAHDALGAAATILVKVTDTIGNVHFEVTKVEPAPTPPAAETAPEPPAAPAAPDAPAQP